MFPWVVRVEVDGTWRTVAKCAHVGLARALADHLLLTEGTVAEVHKTDGVRFR